MANGTHEDGTSAPPRRGRPVGTCPDCRRRRVLYGDPGRCQECRCGGPRGLTIGERYDLNLRRQSLVRRAGQLALALAARVPWGGVRGTREWGELERLAGELARLRAKGVPRG